VLDRRVGQRHHVEPFGAVPGHRCRFRTALAEDASVGSIERHGNRWQARRRSPDGESRARNFPRKVDAEEFLLSVEHTKRTAAYVDPTRGRVSFRSYAEEWRGIQAHHRTTTAAQTETNLRRHVYPILGDRPLDGIRHSEIQGAVAAWSSRLAPATVEVVYRLVVRIFRAAVRDRAIATHPCADIRARTSACRGSIARPLFR
jgi:hypothetical protein